MSDVECPTCGRDDFASEGAMKGHHAKKHGESIAGVDLECEECGNEFNVDADREDTAKYCSVECSDKAKRKDRIKKTCVVCGTKFERLPSRKDEQACSNECKGAMISKKLTKEKIEKECVVCGAEFEVVPSLDRVKCCSKECGYEAQKGRWKKECEQCGDVFTASDLRQRYCSKDCSAEQQRDRVSLSCEQCGDTFEVTSSRADTARFCSRNCHSEWMVGNIGGTNHPNWKDRHEIICEQCGEVFEVRPSRSDARFCSMECKGKAHRENFVGEKNPSWAGGDVILECLQCDDNFGVIPSRADEAKFCSEGCYGDWYSENLSGENSHLWKGGYKYESGWPEKREKARKRDEYQCQCCGMIEKEQIQKHGRKLSVHHIRPLMSFNSDYERADRLENLITVCDACHPVVEKMAPLLPSGVKPTGD